MQHKWLAKRGAGGVLSELVQKKIAIVEDDKAIAQMYKLKLENEGFDVELAANGHEGFELVKKQRPHLVLLDLRMPDMTGDEMLEHMRATEWGRNINVVIAANVDRQHAPWRLHLLDFDRYLIKAHYTPRQIMDVIHEVLGTTRKKSFPEV